MAARAVTTRFEAIPQVLGEWRALVLANLYSVSPTENLCLPTTAFHYRGQHRDVGGCWSRIPLSSGTSNTHRKRRGLAHSAWNESLPTAKGSAMNNCAAASLD